MATFEVSLLGLALAAGRTIAPLDRGRSRSNAAEALLRYGPGWSAHKRTRTP